MQGALKDKTNKKVETSVAKDGAAVGEKEAVITYLRGAAGKTGDQNLRYDISKCIEILEGKENQEALDLKDVLEEVLLEREVLFREKCELVIELDLLKPKDAHGQR